MSLRLWLWDDVFETMALGRWLWDDDINNYTLPYKVNDRFSFTLFCIVYWYNLYS